jgi:glycosyltransferase involved in cell wall biosynthesis
MKFWKGDVTKPLVSVSIVTYNHEYFIESTLDSILDQVTNFSFEVVIGDDFSLDKTKEKLKKYKLKYPNIIKLILHKSNIGAQANFSYVSYSCIGKYIAHIDGDDLMLPRKLQIQVDFLDKNKDFIAVGHPVRVFDSDTNKTILKYDLRFLKCFKEKFSKDDILSGAPFAHSSKMYRKEAIESMQIDLKTKNVGDYLMHIQHGSLGKFGCIDKVLGEYRIHDKSQNSINMSNKMKALDDVIYSLDKAIQLGYDKDKVIEKKNFTFFNYSIVFLKIDNLKEFQRLIALSGCNNIFASKLHFIVYKLKNYPKILSFILKMFFNE